MKLIKIQNGEMSVVEISDENCEEPCNGTTAVFDKREITGGDWNPTGAANHPDSGKVIYRDGEYFIYEEQLHDKLKQLQTTQIVTCHYWEGDWENDGGSSLEEKSAFQMIFGGSGSEIDRWSIIEDSIEEIVTNLCEGTNDCDYVGFCMTKGEYDKMEAEKLRKSLEQTAASFAAECGHPVGSVEYVNAAWDKLEKAHYEKEVAFSGESQMERFAACRFAGCSDSYWSDEDYLQDKYNEPINQIGDVLEWLENNFPLLMLKAKEARAQRELE